MTLVLMVLPISANHAGMETPNPKQEKKWNYPHLPNPDYLLDSRSILFSFHFDF